MIYYELKKHLSLPDFFTLTGLIFSIFSIFYSLKKEFMIAMISMFIAMIFDYYDGKIARAIKRKGRFGVELDNLSDVILYLIIPVIFGFAAGLNNEVAIIVYIIFILCGVMRLARFAVCGTKDGCYEGLPVSYTMIIPMFYFIFINLGISINYLLWLYFIPSFLMISMVRVKKI